jgi:hypothetical protein
MKTGNAGRGERAQDGDEAWPRRSHAKWGKDQSQEEEADEALVKQESLSF